MIQPSYILCRRRIDTFSSADWSMAPYFRGLVQIAADNDLLFDGKKNNKKLNEHTLVSRYMYSQKYMIKLGNGV